MGLVYSTNKNIRLNEEETPCIETLAPHNQKLVVSIDRRNRGGKQVTLIKGFIGTVKDLEDLARIVKAKCGVGGSAKDGEIIIQGDFRDKAFNLLSSMGYNVKRGN
ncbi:MAG: translation initiation factor [Bacteroidales bacterium]|nr:translation initiation factor [Bacteroidales bacterium]